MGGGGDGRRGGVSGGGLGGVGRTIERRNFNCLIDSGIFEISENCSS